MTISEQAQEAPKDNTANSSITLSTADFLREYFRGTEGAVFVCSYRNPDSKLPKGELGKIVTRDPGAVSKFVVSRDKPEHENGIYFSTATYKPDVISRVSENCLQFVSLFADVDDKNHELKRDVVLALLENAESPPTLIVSSGHGLQPYWLLTEPVDDRKRVEAARKKLNALTASDAVHDAARIMRLVGSHNSKFGDWCEVEVVSYRPEYRYTLEALEDWLDRAKVIVPRKHEPEQQTNGHAHTGNGYDYYGDGPADIDRIRDALRCIPADDREIWFKVGMALKDELGDPGFSVWDDWSHLSSKYDKDDQEAKWKSFKRDGIGIGTLFGYAKQRGWDSRRNKDGHANDSDAGRARHDSKHSSNGTALPEILESARGSSFQMKAVQWLWPNRFAIGKLGIIAGLPDEGKGQVLCDIAARITSKTDKRWPCNEGVAPDGNIILLTAEDDPEDTVAPRLASAGADLDRIEFVKMVRNDKSRRRMFSLVTDLELLRQKVTEVGNVKAIQIDPISAYLGHGKIDSYRTTEVRAVLGPLVDLAAELKLAIIAIMHFNKKVDVTNALLRISDSLAFGAAARHVYGVVADSENDRKLFVRAKNNLSAKSKDKALAFRFGGQTVGNDAETGQEIWAPHVLWEPDYVDITATQAMQAAADNKSPGELDRAKRFLRELLGAGPVKAEELKDAAEANDVTAATLRRAKKGVAETGKERGRIGGEWYWRLKDVGHKWPWEQG